MSLRLKKNQGRAILHYPYDYHPSIFIIPCSVFPIGIIRRLTKFTILD